MKSSQQMPDDEQNQVGESQSYSGLALFCNDRREWSVIQIYGKTDSEFLCHAQPLEDALRIYLDNHFDIPF
ncbi:MULTISPECIES: hypothetical protein [Aerosakkonema]|uniref:hypothetical protein n=1 Tax=Aerosakkonema TaxID=1246629 RepID=UPI0035BB00D9